MFNIRSALHTSLNKPLIIFSTLQLFDPTIYRNNNSAAKRSTTDLGGISGNRTIEKLHLQYTNVQFRFLLGGDHPTATNHPSTLKATKHHHSLLRHNHGRTISKAPSWQFRRSVCPRHIGWSCSFAWGESAPQCRQRESRERQRATYYREHRSARRHLRNEEIGYSQKQGVARSQEGKEEAWEEKKELEKHVSDRDIDIYEQGNLIEELKTYWRSKEIPLRTQIWRSRENSSRSRKGDLTSTRTIHMAWSARTTMSRMNPRFESRNGATQQ